MQRFRIQGLSRHAVSHLRLQNTRATQPRYDSGLDSLRLTAAPVHAGPPRRQVCGKTTSIEKLTISLNNLVLVCHKGRSKARHKFSQFPYESTFEIFPGSCCIQCGPSRKRKQGPSPTARNRYRSASLKRNYPLLGPYSRTRGPSLVRNTPLLGPNSELYLGYYGGPSRGGCFF